MIVASGSFLSGIAFRVVVAAKQEERYQRDNVESSNNATSPLMAGQDAHQSASEEDESDRVPHPLACCLSAPAVAPFAINFVKNAFCEAGSELLKSFAVFWRRRDSGPARLRNRKALALWIKPNWSRWLTVGEKFTLDGIALRSPHHALLGLAIVRFE